MHGVHWEINRWKENKNNILFLERSITEWSNYWKDWVSWCREERLFHILLYGRQGDGYARKCRNHNGVVRKIIMTYVIFIYAIDFLTPSWFVDKRVLFIRMFIRHWFGSETGFVHKDFIATFWSLKCFWWLEVMFIRKFITALLWTILWIKC